MKSWVRCISAFVAMVGMAPLWAEEVTPEQARMAARNWIGKSPTRMTAKFATSDAADVQTSKNADGRALYHVVKLAGGGYVVTAGDTELPPVIAFSESGILNLDDSGNPLIALLERDMGRRIGLVGGGAPKIKQSQGGLSPFEAEWAELTGGGEKREDGKAVVPKESLSSLSDVRVAPLVQSKWDQSLWNSQNTFNYYTPNNYVCGCVATAFAQIMRYWQQPTSSVSARSYYCKVDGSSCYRTMKGGTYSWSNMPLTSSSCTSATQRQAIGKLTYDLGVASQMNWTLDGSGTMGFAASQALKSVFGYASSQAYFDVTGWGLDQALQSQTDFRDAILASLDAGMPCAVGVGGDNGGHEMVLDGYGFSGSVIYSHINCGWSGSEDAWYNFFGEYVTSYSFDYMDELGYNIHPTTTGDVLSGRVLNSSGSPVSGATVSLTKGGVTKKTTTNSKGIYAFRITSSGTYAVSATYSSLSGSTTATVSTMSASTTAVLDSNGSFSTSVSNGTLGNKWGVDITVRQGSSVVELTSISISGSSSVAANGTATYSCTATMSDNSTDSVMPEWSITSDGLYASINSAGELTANNTTPSVQSETIMARYTLNGVTKTATKTVTIEALQNKEPTFTITDGVLLAVDLNGCTSVTIPDSVTVIGYQAFYGCNLECVTIPDSVKIIEWDAFFCCGLTSVTIPDSVMSIADGAFSSCTGLTSVTMPRRFEGNLDDSVFLGCPENMVITYYDQPYTIRFHRNDANDGKVEAYEFDYGVETRLPSLNSLGWARRGFDFLGWATSEANAAAGKVWKKDWAVVSTAAEIGETIDVWAVWKLKDDSYAIQFIRNDGAGTWRTVGFKYGEKTRMPSLANGLGWARRGYNFKGWALTTADAAAGKVWKADWSYVATAAAKGTTLTVYAVWELKTGYYQIRFNKNDGTTKWRSLGFAVATERDPPTKLSTIAALGWERAGYTFMGWASSKANADAGKVWKADGATVKNAAPEGKTLSIYAIWER